MKLKTLITAAAFTAVGLSGSAVAQTAESNVVGFYTLTLVQGFNPIGVNLHTTPLATGTLTDESGSVVADSNNDFSGLSTLASTQTLLIEIETGGQAGAVAEVTSVGTTALFLAESLGAGTADYTVRRAATLNELFSGVAAGGVAPGPTLDLIWLPDGSGGFTTYGYNIGGSEFRPTAGAGFFSPVAKDIPVFYPDGLFFERKAAGSVNVVIAGDLKSGGTVVAAAEGFNLVASPGPEGVNFGNSNLDAFLVGGVAPGPTLDQVWLPDGVGGFTTYGYNIGAGVFRPTAGAGFFSGDSSGVELTSGFFIERKTGNGDTAGIADVPGFYSGL